MTKRNIIIIRIFLWLILAASVGWFSYLKIAPSGKINFVNDFIHPQFFITRLTPAERVEINKGEVKIKGDPVYFTIKTPRKFNHAKITVKFKNTADYPVMELGLLNDKVSWSYDLKPLQNKIIDQLAMVWPVIDDFSGIRLIQREKKYQTVESFLSHLPPVNEIAVYNYNFKNRFLLDKYSPLKAEQTINYNFRGSYQFYTYLKNEELNFNFYFSDLNQNKDNDPIDIKVYSPDGLIHSEHLADDNKASSERQSNIRLLNLAEGVYRVSVAANDDIVTNKIISRQAYFALINKVWLADGNKNNLELWTNSREITAQTTNPGSLGKIKIGDDALELKETYKQFSIKTGNQPVKVETAKDDIMISGDGVFGLAENNWFDPRLKIVDRNIDINQEKINYILTNYKSQANVDEWRTMSVDFDLTRAYQEKGKYQFIISIPGLRAEAPANGEIIIKEISADLTGTSLEQKIKKYFNK